MTAIGTFVSTRSTRDLSAWTAILASVAAALAPVPWLPGLARGLLLLAFVLAGPGLAVTAWTRLSGILLASVVPVIGLTAVILVTTVVAFLGWWSPIPTMFALAVVCAASGAAALLTTATATAAAG
jgi:hypothetical protein